MILNGIFFDEAGGTVGNVIVEGMTRNNGAQGAGHAANAIAGPARTVTITGTTVSGYQKGGLVALGIMTMNVSGSTIGPPDPLPPGFAERRESGGLWRHWWFATASTIHGSGYGLSSTAGTAILLLSAADVTLSGNSVVGEDTDVGCC